MKKHWTKRSLLIFSLIFSLTVVAAVLAGPDGSGKVKANLSGFQEVPSISTTGHGEFEAKIDEAAQTITFTLSFADMEGPVNVAHIHFAQRGVSGPVMIDLCGATKPPCPAGGGTVTEVIVPADVKPLPNQGIEQGNFAEAVRAIRSGNTYVNVHSGRFPSGEIRGQIRDDRDIKD